MSAPQASVFDAVRTPWGRGKKAGRLHKVKPISLDAAASTQKGTQP